MARAESKAGRRSERDTERDFLVGVARGAGGALVFGLPLFMTMEMWELGFTMERHKVALLVVSILPLLHGLAYYSGFEETVGYRQAALDALAAFAVATLAAIGVLGLLSLLRGGMSASELVGKVALQGVAGSFGALLALSQFGDRADEEKKRRETGDFGELFFMLVGALFLAANVAPTDDVERLALKLTHGHALLVALASMGVMHAFVYGVGFRGQPDVPEGASGALLFLRFTVGGYALCLLASAYMLWIVGRLELAALAHAVKLIVVLGFPASVGAAAARLIL